MNARPANTDAYLAALPDEARATLEGLRRQIMALVADAAEVISYGMPAFRYRGRILVYIGAARKHCAIYGMSAVIEAHRRELANYDTSKGTIRFPPGEPPPEALLRTLLAAQTAQIDAALSARAPSRRAAD